jgi:hypothetical protein
VEKTRREVLREGSRVVVPDRVIRLRDGTNQSPPPAARARLVENVVGRHLERLASDTRDHLGSEVRAPIVGQRPFRPEHESVMNVRRKVCCVIRLCIGASAWARRGSAATTAMCFRRRPRLNRSPTPPPRTAKTGALGLGSCGSAGFTGPKKAFPERVLSNSEAPISRRISQWRDPESNRGHHDFQSCDLLLDASSRRAAAPT